MKITAQKLVPDFQITQSCYTKEAFDVFVKEELCHNIGNELKTHVVMIQSHETKPIPAERYQIQLIVLSTDTFKNLMNTLEDLLPYHTYQQIRDSLNEKI